MEITITTNQPALCSFLKAGFPAGVEVRSTHLDERRGVDLNLSANIDFKLVIDLSEIIAYSFASWLVSKALVLKGSHCVKINGKNIAIDDSNAIDLIANEIDNKK